jgi:tRNA A-37 threonylcarbamoyl transferase component Bud32
VITARAGAVGDLIAGRYRLLQELGAGAMGSVWRAYDERLQRRVAVKRVLPYAGTEIGGDLRARVFREGRIAARLQHPHAVAVFDVVEDDGFPVLVMEYLPSTSLAEVLHERGALPVGEAAEIGAQVAAALAAAHAAGVVHRDVKPGNVLLAEDGAKITDFGIAHAAGDATITTSGIVAGTPAYLPPETVHGQRPTPKSDVYSLGATLYTAVEGVTPFGRDVENPYAVLYRIAAGGMRPPSKAGPLTPVLTAMLARSPADRPTAEEACEALRAVAGGRALPATARLPRPRRRVLATVAAGLAAAAALAYVFVDKPAVGTPPPPPAVVASAPSAAQLENAVSDYYALLPAQPDAAWQRLSAAGQTEGFDAYRQHWARTARLTVTTAPRAEGTTVTVGLTLAMTDGSTTRETHRIAFDGLLLGADTLVASEHTAPPPPAVTRTEVRAPDPVEAAPPPAGKVDHGKHGGKGKGRNDN